MRDDASRMRTTRTQSESVIRRVGACNPQPHFRLGTKSEDQILLLPYSQTAWNAFNFCLLLALQILKS